MNWEELKENSTLEDIYNLIDRNVPDESYDSLYDEFIDLKEVIAEELRVEEENPIYCEKLIGEAIELLKRQKEKMLNEK